MLIADLQERIRQIITSRCAAGEFTQASLSEKLGTTQTHVSNFVNRNRGLRIETIDKILSVLDLELEDLLPSQQLRLTVEQSAEELRVPLIKPQFSMRPTITKNRLLGMVSYRKEFIRRLRSDSSQERRCWPRFIAAEISSGAGGAMHPRFGNGAVALIDRHFTSVNPHQKNSPNLYLIRKESDYLIRHVEQQGTILCLRPENSNHRLDFIQIKEKHPVEFFIVGRVAHIGAET